MPGQALKPGEAGFAIIWEKDGSEMVYVPAGEFQMGTTPEQGAAIQSELSKTMAGHFWPGNLTDLETPAHTVFLDGYYIDKYPVTNAQYARFLLSDPTRRPPGGWSADGTLPAGIESHPAVYLSWDDADAYARWAGKQLPTEAQWEKAARGIDGRIWPWGNTWDSSRLFWLTGWVTAMAPVGSYPAGASPYGAMDMMGNGAEWCRDWLLPAATVSAEAGDWYYRFGPRVNPIGPGDPTTVRPWQGRLYKAVRDFSSDSVTLVPRVAARFTAQQGDAGREPIGVRCVLPVGSPTRPAITVLPGFTQVNAGGKVAFVASVAGPAVGALRWSAEARGEATGTITPDGTFTAPKPSDFQWVVVRAASLDDPSVQGAAVVLVSPRVAGDVSGDGRLSVPDALLALRAAVGLASLDEASLSGADVDGSGAVEISDVVRVLRLAVGPL